MLKTETFAFISNSIKFSNSIVNIVKPWNHCDNSASDLRRDAPKSRRLNVVVRSLPLYPRGGPKWRDNYSDGPDHPVAPQLSGIIFHFFV